MAIDDIVTQTNGLVQAVGDKYYQVQGGFIQILPGELVQVAGNQTGTYPTKYAYSLYNSTVSTQYVTGFTKPLIGTDLIVGVAQSNSTQSTTSGGADGNVQVTPLIPGVIYRSRFSLHKAFTFTGNLTSGSQTISSVSSVVGLVVGQTIGDNSTAANIPVGTVISSIGTTSITISQPAGGTATADVIQVYAPAMLFTGSLATGTATVSTLSSLNGFVGGTSQVIFDSTSATNLVATTLTTIGTSTLTLSGNSTASATGDTLVATLVTTDGQTVTQAQYNALVNQAALVESYLSPLDGKYHMHVLPSTQLNSSKDTNGLIIRYLDVVKYPGQIAFELRQQLSDSY